MSRAPAVPLAVEVVWHSADPGSVHSVAEAIFRELTGDPDGGGRSRTGIPVFFRRISGSAATIAEPKGWPAATRRAVVLLADDDLIGELTTRNSPVRTWISTLMETAQAKQWLVLPVALTDRAFDSKLVTTRLNAVRPGVRLGETPAEFVAAATALELHRLLAPGRTVGVFISYARRDGTKIAEELKAYLDADTQLEPFLDRTDIHAGEEFARVLDSSVITGPVVAIVTDAYAASVWCGREIMLAKQAGQPVFMISAPTDGHERSMPYAGNGPVVCLSRDNPTETFRRIERLAVRESLRRSYLPLRVAHVTRLAGAALPDHVFARPPELMTLTGLGTKSATVVYPDPPLPTTELELLAAAFPKIRLRTPTEMWR